VADRGTARAEDGRTGATRGEEGRIGAIERRRVYRGVPWYTALGEDQVLKSLTVNLSVLYQYIYET
jgi:hypothetical protein